MRVGSTVVAAVVLLAAAPMPLAGADAAPHHTVLVEAEAFDHYGGWVDDSQFMDQMGSSFLLAHGLGVPVEDATTTLELPAAGTYRVLVRTRDWVAPWDAPGAPGRFELVVGGKTLDATFGTEGAAWHWHNGGTVELPGGKVPLVLHDLTGFEGRCDAIVLSTDPDFTPPNADPGMAQWRRELLGIGEQPEDGGEFDLVVVGGGIAGTCAALSAARLGLSVALIQDRPVLGGNNSSEVRVWLQGARNKEPYPRVGDVVRELEQRQSAHYGPSNTAEIYEDEKKLDLVRAEEGLSLFLLHRANGVEMKAGRIAAVIAQHTKTGVRRRFAGRWFADTTGDGCLGQLAGADFEMTEKGHMGRCNLWNVAGTDRPQPFPRCPWALDLSDKPFPGRGADEKRGILALGGWYWESGFDHDPFEKSEYIRDWNFRAAYGAWDALKNVDALYPNHKLNWMAYVAGKRESRRLLGDLVLSKEDLITGKEYPDGCAPTGWKIDLHLPHPQYVKGFEGDAFISRALFTNAPQPYWIPYRCLYSRNVPNLFMAGRDISVTHDALGSIRVMRTGGCMGEIVGMAASLCKKYDGDPRDVYTNYLDDLKKLMVEGVGRLPPEQAAAAEVALAPPNWIEKLGPNLAREATVTAPPGMDAGKHTAARINDGVVGPLRNEQRYLTDASLPHEIELRFAKPQAVAAARVVSGYVSGGGVVGPIEDFGFQYHDGTDWKNLPGADATANAKADWSSRFPAVTTERVRLVVTRTQTAVSRIWEIELYGPK